MKNPAIEFLRFLMVSILCFWHCYVYPMPYLYHGYLVVDFFFILSGYLMYQSIAKKGSVLPFDYTINKVQRFLPVFIVSLVLCYVIKLPQMVSWPLHLVDIDYLILNPLGDLLFLQGLGIYDTHFNVSAWYLSVLIWGGLIVYYSLTRFKETSLHLIFPIFLLLALPKFVGETHRLDAFYNDGWIRMPVLRGMVELIIGVLSAHLYGLYSRCLNWLGKQWVQLLLFVPFLLLFFIWRNMDEYALILSPLLIMSCFVEDNAFVRLCRYRACTYLGSLSFTMFLIHHPLVCILDYYLPHFDSIIIVLPSYFAVVVLLSIFINGILKKYDLEVFRLSSNSHRS